MNTPIAILGLMTVVNELCQGRFFSALGISLIIFGLIFASRL